MNEKKEDDRDRSVTRNVRTIGFIPWTVHALVVAREAAAAAAAGPISSQQTHTSCQIARVYLSSQTARLATGAPHCLPHMGQSRAQGRPQGHPRADRCPDRPRVRRLSFSSSLAVAVILKKPMDCCSNMLSLVPEGEQPRSRIVGPKLEYMDERIAAIDLVISKLVRCRFLRSHTSI